MSCKWRCQPKPPSSIGLLPSTPEQLGAAFGQEQMETGESEQVHFEFQLLSCTRLLQLHRYFLQFMPLRSARPHCHPSVLRPPGVLQVANPSNSGAAIADEEAKQAQALMARRPFLWK